MVVPVVVVGDIQVLRSIFAQAQQVALTRIPEVVVGKSHVGRLFAVQGAVALGLVGGAAGLAVEEVAVVHPDVVVVLLQADVVALVAVAVHRAEVAHLHVGGVLDAQAPAVGHGIVAHTFHGDAAGSQIVIFHHEVAVQHVGQVGNLAHQAHEQRARVAPPFKPIENALQPHAGVGGGPGHVQGNGVFGGLRNVNNHGIAFHRAVEVISTRHPAAAEGKPGAVLGQHGQGAGYRGGAFHAPHDGHNPQRVRARRQAQRIGPVKGAVAADELVVELLVDDARATVVHVVALGRGNGLPLHVGRLQPAIRLYDGQRLGAQCQGQKQQQQGE